MRIRVLAVGTRLPAWQQQGFREYARRLPKACAVELVEIAAARRGKRTSAAQALDKESHRLLAALAKNDYVVALDRTGVQYATEDLAARLDTWLGQGRDVAMLIGGADGLSHACLTRADLRWSLSDLTLPHGLARVLVAEQLYRAWSILRGHPYHRGE
ncbi:MAG: 23S rRNA (pseudouridine(1915)-N(3))-methyltransferase RlmH [Gammaproteobacteria bacterium]|nr:23S rRNA (pseudouridine(1915)-N(3))-methyltransferase RlmH [Gammaproteobacteria bacterium]NIO23696.1 23S rRNA (pseudouridine(1915)-N(3))-methyltransferase RlmH [Gammaproteobacteria bacterium]NIO64312.1 23S rRNA (pseudouridine(1915)-N(3))-methyltransferase RlmH [Gammaproteobacteria bacterium]NIP46165.1 23S rRNA (pseudouridine(1915)-N(3))-methyltransferase RlmH [Gammaproteobacteria bacterium]NIP63194.1 23S rRNA (pseudouridine(1915)-N(3))-methyltransferase RlmH [Gammaproteobacteria bacterium]